jgi:hypothetical protein
MWQKQRVSLLPRECLFINHKSYSLRQKELTLSKERFLCGELRNEQQTLCHSSLTYLFQTVKSDVVCGVQSEFFICPRPNSLALCLSYLLSFGPFAYFSHLDRESCMAFSNLVRCVSSFVSILFGILSFLSRPFLFFCLNCPVLSLCFASLVFFCPNILPVPSHIVPVSLTDIVRGLAWFPMT